MNLPERIKSWWSGTEKPLHLRHGELGERAAKRQLKRQGLKFLTANFRSPRGEIDLIFRDGDCLQSVDIGVNRSRGPVVHPFKTSCEIGSTTDFGLQSLWHPRRIPA